MNTENLLKNRTLFLTWKEPHSALDVEGEDVDSYITLKASVQDCINASRLHLKNKGHEGVSDEILLHEFIVAHWAEVEDK